MSNGNHEAAPGAELICELRHFIARAILNNQRVAERAGLHVTDLQCINILDLMGPLRPSELAQLTGLTTGGVTVVLDRLEKAKYIRREPNPNDRRSVLVRVIPGRVGKLDAHYETIRERMRTVLAAFTAAELAAVLKFFKATNAVRPGEYMK
jgi:MarR family transcriptional regulator, organic hydroperoxide resistance regulator